MPPIRTVDLENISESRRVSGRARVHRRQDAEDTHLTRSSLSLHDTRNLKRNKRSDRVSSSSHSSLSPTLYSDTSSTTEATREYANTKADVDDRFSDTITICGIDLRPTVAFDTFWRFAAERKAIDDRRRAGESAPFTEDKILRNYFFCNTFRVLDKVSQYLIREVIEKGSQDPTEVVFRVILFNSFTRIETWELLDRKLGPLRWKTFDLEKYRKVLAEAVAGGATLYTGAFIKPAPHFGPFPNYVNHLYLLESFMEQNLTSRLLNARYMANIFEYLISFPSMGDFTTYQLILCLSYTKVLNFHPDDLVVTGPGSTSGLNKLFGKSINQGRTQVEQFDVEVMRYLASTQAHHFERLGLEFSGLGPKRLPMSLADIEHTLCEVDKYCRVAHPHLKGKKTHLQRIFRPPAEGIPSKAIVPKAWSHSARRTPRIRPEKTLLVEKRYEVNYLKEHQDTPDGRKYLVFWVGYSPSEASWEFESSLMEDAPHTVYAYFAKQKK